MSGAADEPFHIEELLRPAAFPHEVGRLEVRETNISWVILTGTFAYKIKKGLKLEFFDAATLARRRFLCEEEIRLNARLAAELYLDVVPITRGAGGLRVGGCGPAIEYAVRMRQFDGTQELHVLLARAEVGLAEITRLAERLAAFHGAAPVIGRAHDYPERLRKIVLANLDTLLAHLDARLRPRVHIIEDWVRASLERSAGALREREVQGSIRECHGDLHARNIVRWQGQLLPFDCLEFDPSLREIDVMSDLAFLLMDLVSHAAGGLAYACLSRYLERTGDYPGVALLPLYAVDRALVRAMVDALAAEQRPDRHDEHYRLLERRIETAHTFMHPREPTLYIMHGPSGSGKSWLSERLVPRVAALRIRSDLERKRLAGLEPAARASPELYAAGMTARTYAHLAASAGCCLSAGSSVLVDAAFLFESQRQSFLALAQRHGARFRIIACRAGERELAARIARRQAQGRDPSDADVAVLRRQLAQMQPLSPAELAFAVEVDTSAPEPERAVLAALAEAPY